MIGADVLHRDIEALRARFAALGEASLRISASLGDYTVLREVAGSTRALTGARYGAIATTVGTVRLFLTAGPGTPAPPRGAFA